MHYFVILNLQRTIVYAKYYISSHQKQERNLTHVIRQCSSLLK